MSRDLNEVTTSKGITHTEQETCEKVFGDVTKSEADDDARKAGTSEHGQSQTGQSGHLKDEIDAEEKNRDRDTPVRPQ